MLRESVPFEGLIRCCSRGNVQNKTRFSRVSYINVNDQFSAVYLTSVNIYSTDGFFIAINLSVSDFVSTP